MKDKKILFLLFSIFIFYNCSDDELIRNNNSAQELNLKVAYEKSISFSDLKENSKIIGKLSKNLQTKKYGVKTLNKNHYSIEIDTSSVTYIQKNDYHSYTFLVKNSDQSNLIQNLVFSLKENGDYNVGLFNYNLTEEDKTLIQNNISIDYTNKLEIINLNKQNSNSKYVSNSSASCFNEITIYVSCCSGEHYYGESCRHDGSDCAPKPPYSVLVISEDCFEGGGEIFQPITQPGNGGNENGGGNGNTDITETPGQTNNPPNEDSNSPNEPVEDFEDIITKPILEVKPKTLTNCDELKTNSNDTIFKERMSTLKTEITSNVEKGFGIYNGNYTQPKRSNPTNGNILPGSEQNGPNTPYHISLKAMAHNHLKDSSYNHIGTFSPNDLIAFSNLIIEAEAQSSPVAKEEFATYLVCNEGNYALKVNDIDKLYNFAHKYATDTDFKDIINNFYERNDMLHGNEKKKQNLGFLKLLKKFDIGVDYYEADENFENWEKLELNYNGNDITKKPC